MQQDSSSLAAKHRQYGWRLPRSRMSPVGTALRNHHLKSQQDRNFLLDIWFHCIGTPIMLRDESISYQRGLGKEKQSQLSNNCPQGI